MNVRSGDTVCIYLGWCLLSMKVRTVLCNGLSPCTHSFSRSSVSLSTDTIRVHVCLPSLHALRPHRSILPGPVGGLRASGGHAPGPGHRSHRGSLPGAQQGLRGGALLHLHEGLSASQVGRALSCGRHTDTHGHSVHSPHCTWRV